MRRAPPVFSEVGQRVSRCAVYLIFLSQHSMVPRRDLYGGRGHQVSDMLDESLTLRGRRKHSTWKEHARNGQIYRLPLSVLQKHSCHCYYLSPFCSHGDIREIAGPQYPWQSSEGDGEGVCICGDVNSGRLSEERGGAECPFVLQHKCALPLLRPRFCVVHSAEISTFISLVLAQFSFHFSDWVIWVSISTRFMYVMQMARFFLLHGCIIFYSTCKAFWFYQFISQRTFRSIPCLACCVWCCSEQEKVDHLSHLLSLPLGTDPDLGVVFAIVQ